MVPILKMVALYFKGELVMQADEIGVPGSLLKVPWQL